VAPGAGLGVGGGTRGRDGGEGQGQRDEGQGGNNILDSAGGSGDDPDHTESSVWLPEGFAFLSGLPTPARKRRLIVPIQAFVDDSGAKGHEGF
jgi:hypothetical protein